MRAVRGRDTSPERIVLAIVRARRFRPRVNDESLPGKPDLVFPRRRVAIFVHGCFWHRHACAGGRSTPAANRAFWLRKFRNNQARDAAVRRRLRLGGWRVVVVWECQTRPRRRGALERKLLRILHAADVRRASV